MKLFSKGVFEMKRIVIFGAAGTLGLYLTDHFAGKLNFCEWEVVASGRSLIHFFDRYAPLVRYIPVDITDEKSFDILPQEDVYAIIHLAGALPAYMKGYDPRQYVNANVMGTLNVLEYARKVNADRILYTQTISDYHGYFDEMVELRDDMPRRPPMTGDHSVYAITKIAAEQLCWNYQASYGLKCFAFRLPNIYCYMHDSKTLYRDGKPASSSYRYLIRRAMDGKPLEVWGDPNKGMDLIYVKDFCQMMEKAVFSDRAEGGTYNVGTGKMTSLGNQIKNIIEVFSPKDNPSSIVYRPEMQDCVNYYMNIDKARNELGYEPQYDPISFLIDYKTEMEQDRFADFFRERYER